MNKETVIKNFSSTHPGKFLAFDDQDRLVCTGSSNKDAGELAKAKNGGEIKVFYVPMKTER